MRPQKKKTTKEKMELEMETSGLLPQGTSQVNISLWYILSRIVQCFRPHQTYEVWTISINIPAFVCLSVMLLGCRND